MIVNGIEITDETIRKTREHFAKLSQAAIRAAESGEDRVNDLPAYVSWHSKMAADSLAGKGDHTLTFMQRALWIQTGECPPMLGGVK
jgi:hypothetical protein